HLDATERGHVVRAAVVEILIVSAADEAAKIARVLSNEVLGQLMDQGFGGTELALDAVIAVAFETAIHDDAKKAPAGRDLNRFNPIDTQHKASVASVNCLRAFRRGRQSEPGRVPSTLPV